MNLRLFVAASLGAALQLVSACGTGPRPSVRSGFTAHADPREPAGQTGRPNILFIAIDDLNDWVGPLGGHPQVKTPALDALARRGTVFLNAHVQSPICNPSRTSLLTGLRPTTTGVYGLAPWFRDDPRFADHPTLLQHFRSHGYHTATTGKIFHDGHPPRPRQTDGSEVDTWGFLGGFAPRPAQRLVPGSITHPMIDWGIYPERDEDQDDAKVADWAIEFLRHPPRAPFFLSVGFRHPHVPLFATRRWFDLYPENDLVLPPVRDDDRDDVPRFAWYLHWKLPEPRLAWLQGAGQWANNVRSYLASVSFVDDLVGRVVRALADTGLERSTIIVVFSDHGYHLGEKGITGKNTLWERSTRVPLIFAGPGIAAGQRSARTAELLDLYPTLAELADLPRPAVLEGRSLRPQLRDPLAPREFPAITSHGPDCHSVRDEHYRYIRYGDGTEELYDLRQDPNEWRNLAHDPTLTGLRQRLKGFIPAVSARPLPGVQTRVIEMRDGIPYWEGAPIGPMDPIPGP